MSSIEIAVPSIRPARRRLFAPVVTLAQRRFRLTARTPRELVVPLLTPIMFALVIAPSIKTALHTEASYEAFVAVGTVGLLVPLTSLFAGLSVLVDRNGGAQRELLAAPVPRGLLVLGNLAVVLVVAAFQVATPTRGNRDNFCRIRRLLEAPQGNQNPPHGLWRHVDADNSLELRQPQRDRLSPRPRAAYVDHTLDQFSTGVLQNQLARPPAGPIDHFRVRSTFEPIRR